MACVDQEDLTQWIGRLFDDPAMLRMGHNQKRRDLNLGLGWLYYSMARILRPQTVVVIGSYRGFVPLVIGKALSDNDENATVLFIDPSLVDDFWKEPHAVAEHFQRFGLTNVEHFLMTTQQFVNTPTYRNLTEVGLVFVDGYHSQEQVQFDYEAFESLLAPRGTMLFHDSMLVRQSPIYGPDRVYETRVKFFLQTLSQNPNLELFTLPFGSGLTMLRKLDGAPSEPFNEGVEQRLASDDQVRAE
jgi:predicted O-methyltransferase YrrM